MLNSKLAFAWALAALLSVLVCIPSASANVADDLSVIKERWSAWLVHSADGKSAQYWSGVYVNSIQSDGSWSNVNYTDQNPEVWTTLEHLTRTLLMATAYNTPGDYYQDANLLSKIELAITYWLVTNPMNPNWYQNQLVVPTMFGQIGLLVFDLLPNATVHKVLSSQMSKVGPCNIWTAANHVMCSNVYALTGLLSGNATTTVFGISNIFSVLVIEPGIVEGIKQDGSFYQHGQQLYSGKYGNNVTQDILLMIYLTKNTSLYLTDDQLAVFATHVLDGQQWMVAGPSFDYGVVGRAIARPWTIECTFPPELLAAVGGARAGEWNEFSARLIDNDAYPLYGHRHYWMGDYTAHRTSEYTAYVKMFSNRTYNAECIEEEGKKSLHLSDGSLQFYKTGHEYEFIFAAWNWEHLPGTTIAVGSQPLICTQLKALGLSSFVGGVSDGSYGCSGIKFQSVFNGQLYIKKAWFFFPDFIVNLGSDLQFPSSEYPVVTTMNQCLVNSAVYISSQTDPFNGTQTFDNEIWWVHHQDVAYVFDQSLNVTVENQAQTGAFEAIGQFEGNVTKDIFSVYINHPQGPIVNGGYQYIMIPDITIEDMANVKDIVSPVSVIENSPAIQAVFDNSSNIFQVFFWAAGSVSAGQGWTVTVDQPCALMVSQSGKEFSITVADPNQNPSIQIIQVTIDQELQGPCCGASGGTTLVKMNMPTGLFAGNSATCVCTL